MVYRATNVTQKDGSRLQFSNCRMAVAATHLDFHTKGAKKSTGAKMRSYQDDQSGGTDSGDARTAWDRGYNEMLVIRDGKYWESLLEDRSRGWFVALDVWYAFLSQRCQSTGQFGHTIGIAPETHSTGKWLVGDPLCPQGDWSWMDPAELKNAAEEWGRRILAGVSGRTHGPDGGGDTPGDTGGSVPIRYTTAVEESAVIKVTDKAAVTYDAAVDTPLYDMNGQPVHKIYKAVTQGLSPFACKVGTGTINYRLGYYNVGGVETALLIRTSTITNIHKVAAPSVDVNEILDARDAQWVKHLTAPRIVG